MKKIIIAKKIFELFPEYSRSIIVVENLDNTSTVPKIQELLSEITRSRKLNDLEELNEIDVLKQTFRQLHVNPNDYMPSVVALLKRISKSDLLYINSVVALFNYISLKYLLPCGGDDLNQIEGNLQLDLAIGDEHFLGLGSKDIESPKPGEVIYFDSKSKNIMCRRWFWRNSDFTKIINTTSKIIINIDCMQKNQLKSLFEAQKELTDLLIEHCHAKLTSHILNRNNTQITL